MTTLAANANATLNLKTPLRIEPVSPAAVPQLLRREHTAYGRILAERCSKLRATPGYRLANVTIEHGERRRTFLAMPSTTLRQMADFLNSIADDLESGWLLGGER